MGKDYAGFIGIWSPSFASIFVPKSQALAQLLYGTGAAYSGIYENAVNEIGAAADPHNGANQSVLNPGGEVKAVLEVIYAANTSNPAAPLLLQIINQI